MAFAFVAGSVHITAYKPETPLSSTFKQVIQFNMTALASDTAADIVALATADGSAQALQLKAVLANAGVILNSFIVESPRYFEATALTPLHTLTGTATNPVYTFTGTASTPTALTFCIEIGCDKSKTPIFFNV